MEPGAAAAGSRRVLRRLRDVMAGEGTAQQKLDKIVRIIAADMVAEVCSCYIRRAGDLLELFATEGLRPEAVHRTRLRVGEGLVVERLRADRECRNDHARAGRASQENRQENRTA